MSVDVGVRLLSNLDHPRQLLGATVWSLCGPVISPSSLAERNIKGWHCVFFVCWRMLYFVYH